jgi:hypothetical protein
MSCVNVAFNSILCNGVRGASVWMVHGGIFGCFRSDEAHAGDDHLAARGNIRTYAVGIAHGSQVEAGDWRTPISPSSGDEDLVVGHTVPVLELHDLPFEIDLRGPDPKARLDALVRVEVRRADESILERRLSAQILLRQRRPFVGHFGFCPDQDQVALKTLLSQGNRRAPACKAGSDNDERLGHQTSIQRAPSRTSTL